MSPDPIRTPGVFAVDPADGPLGRAGADAARMQTARVRADDDPDATLRPRRLDEFVGQEALREQLGVSIEAASKRGEALDHVLLAGPPGLGKTSLAREALLGLGYTPAETDALLREVKGDTPEDLIAAALREARR